MLSPCASYNIKVLGGHNNACDDTSSGSSLTENLNAESEASEFGFLENAIKNRFIIPSFLCAIDN
jgi:hypothetical protein